MKNKRGFTIIEMLAVITILSILTILTLVAVQAARETGRKTQCNSNLRQLGIALHAYDSRFGCLPPGHGENGSSIHVEILQDIEQSNLYHSLNLSFNGMSISLDNSTAIATRVSIFNCPSDPGSYGLRSESGTSYAGNRGVGVQAYGYNGAFTLPQLKPVKLQDFIDGTSSTALMSEWIGGMIEAMKRNARVTVFQTSKMKISIKEFDDFSQECSSINPFTARIGAPPYKGQNWLFGEFGTTLYNHTLPPNQHSCTNGTAYQQGAWTAGSQHANGVNVLLGDGHVQFVSDTVNLAVWRAAGSRDGREVVSDK